MILVAFRVTQKVLQFPFFFCSYVSFSLSHTCLDGLAKVIYLTVLFFVDLDACEQDGTY